MRSIFFTAMAILLFATSQAEAQSPFETREQARERHSSERYQQQQRRGTPLGGYGSTLGDPAPSGTSSPGQNSGSGNPGSGSLSGGNNGTGNLAEPLVTAGIPPRFDLLSDDSLDPNSPGRYPCGMTA